MAIEFSEILLEVVGRRASDLHLTAGAPPTLRERGALVAIEGYGPLTPDDTREFIYSILSTEQRRRLETDLQLDFAYLVPGKARFRVNAFFQRGALAAAFRLIPQQMVAIDELGLPPIVHTLTRRPRGLVLV
ncbi:MAG TPA: type IV pili twitching motility protein PilT, partial [Solirubrobacteraceae bacterium]|nr:type IV pili twitching motility protein PilT [Solirubrobacteraceae bacterium]